MKSMDDTISNANRIIYTALLSVAAYVTACSATLIGLSLPDIQCLLGIDLKEASSLLLAYGLGMCCSSVTGHFIRDNVDTCLCMVCTLVLNSVVIAAIPVSPFVWLTITLIVIAGWCTGIITFVRTLHCYIIWPNNFFGVFCVVTGTSVSMITTPLIAKYFIQHRRLVPVDDLDGNTTRPIQEQRCDYFNTNIRYPYIITSGFNLLLAIGLMCCYNTFLRKGDLMEVPPERNRKSTVHKRPSLMFRTFALGISFISSASLMSFLELFVTYGIRSQLHLSADYMSGMTSAFSGGIFLSRFSGVFLSAVIRLDVLMLTSVVLVNVASVLFLLFKDTSIIMMWTNCIMYALGAGSIFPGILAWIQTYSYDSPRFVNVIMLFDYVGMLVHSTLSGMFIGMFGPDAFIYTITGVSFLQLPLCIGLWCASVDVKNEVNTDSIGPLISDQ